MNPEQLKEYLVPLMKDQPIQVTFIKTDGTERTMKCSLQASVIKPSENKTERVRKANPNVLSVWDIENDGWRSFRLDSIKSFSFTIGETNDEKISCD